MMRNRVFAAAVFLALAGAAFATAQEPAARRATGVKVILVGDTNAFPNGDAAADVAGVERYVRGLPGFDADRDLRVLEGDDVTAQKILQTVDDLDVKPTEALLFYYEGHGAYDPNQAAEGDASGGHLLQIESGDLLRADLLDRLKGKGAQLTVLITETCNGLTTYTPPAQTAWAAEEEATVSASLEALLYNYTGVVDVNAAQRDESSWSDPNGGWFTQGMLQVLHDDDLFQSALGGVLAPEDWKSFLDRVSDKTHDRFVREQDDERAQPEPEDQDARKVRQELLDQADERPAVFRLDVQPVGSAEGDDDYVPPGPSFPPDDFLLGK